MRIFFFFCSIILLLNCSAQESLIAYGSKGKATVITRDAEKPLKIGNVLSLATTLKLEAGAMVTLLCRQGTRFVINKPGLYRLSRYKDSCRMKPNSVSSNYFSYLWGQLYSNSEEHRKENHETTLAVTRGEGNDMGTERGPLKRKMSFSRGMDTLLFGDRDFQLCWNCFDSEGPFQFTLFDEQGKQVYIDSIDETYLPVSRFSILLLPTHLYKWTVRLPGEVSARRRVLAKVDQQEIETFVQKVKNEKIEGEDSGSLYFRIAYLLEQAHYLGEAHYYYQLAREKDPGNLLFRKKLISFRNEFYLPQL